MEKAEAEEFVQGAAGWAVNAGKKERPALNLGMAAMEAPMARMAK